MRCISIRPPWSLVVADGRKTIENRKRPTRIRGKVLIHSSKRYEKRAEPLIRKACRQLGLPVPSVEEMAAAPRGAIIGVMTIVECVKKRHAPKSLRPWIFGPYCYVVEGAQIFSMPIPWKGALGFFNVPEAVVARELRSRRRGRRTNRRRDGA